MIQSESNTLYVCEIKFKKSKVGMSIIDEFQSKIDTMSRPANFNIRPVLIHVNGVSDAAKESDYLRYNPPLLYQNTLTSNLCYTNWASYPQDTSIVF